MSRNQSRKFMRQIVCIGIMLALLPLTPGMAQKAPDFIKGTVLTEEGHPVELANIALMSSDGSTFLYGTCTHADGSFNLQPVSEGKYLLQVSYLGYKPLSQVCSTGDAGRLTLLADTLMLKETVVTARRPVYRLKGGILTASIPHTLLSNSGSANDVLKHIPGIHRSEESYTVFGKGSPAIYIDNRLIQSSSELDKLNSKEIEKVELITNPGAEYDATVKAVIRIKTLRHNRKGMGIDARTYLSQGKQTSHLEQLNLNYQKQKLSLYGTFYYLRQSVKRKQDVQYDIFSTSEWEIKSHSDLLSKANTAYGRLGMGYDFAPRHSAGISYEASGIPDARLDVTSDYTVKDRQTPKDETHYTSLSAQNEMTHQANAFYQGEIGKLKIDFTTDIIRRRSYAHQTSHEDSKTEAPRDITTSNRSGSSFYAGKLVLTYPLGQGTLKTGADYTHIRRSDRFVNIQELLPTTNSRIIEKKTAGFAEYSTNIGKVTPTVGLRFEHATSDYWEDGTYIPAQSKIYNDWCPNLSVDFPIGKVQASFSYNVKTNRPSFFELRSSLNYNNRFIYEGGNPLLIPETNHDISLTGLYEWIQFSVSYQFRKNVRAFATKNYEENPDVIIFTLDNFRRMQALNASVSLSPTIGRWKPELGVFAAKPFFTVENSGGKQALNKPTAYFVWNNSFRLPAAITLSLDMDYQTAGNISAMYRRANGGIDAGLRKDFMDSKLNINLQATDVLATRKSSFMLYGSGLTYSKRGYADTRQVRLTVSYRFNATNKQYKGKHASDNDIRRL